MLLKQEPNQNVLYAAYLCIWYTGTTTRTVLCVLSAVSDLTTEINNQKTQQRDGSQVAC
jgi:hypothetical protein